MRKDKPNITFDELYEKINTYITNDKELKKISSAYLFAFEKHFGQKRLSGEEYIIHPLNVAYILAEINADSNTLCAALLHDTIEDGDVTFEELSNKFGREIASLVNGVTKINKLKFTCDNEAVIANHRKILVGLCEDVRILILKLADRLHNMRTLWILSEKRQKANAKETLDILTPIAHRLGMNKIKSELEDLSLRYLKPDAYFSIVEKLNQTRKERDRIVNEMLDNVSNLLKEHNIKHEIIDTYYSEEEATFHERLYIIMSDSENPNVGYNRTHFKEMYGEIYSLKTEYSVYKFKPIEYYHNDINMAMMYGEVLYYKEIMSDKRKIYKYIIKYHNATYKITKDKENIIVSNIIFPIRFFKYYFFEKSYWKSEKKELSYNIVYYNIGVECLYTSRFSQNTGK